ncbi:MAG: GTP cyclohydrolase II [Pseudomonadota bacterium]
MAFSITAYDRRARARADLRTGLPVAIQTADDVLVAAATETLTADRLAEMRALSTVEVALTKWRAQTLAAPAYDVDLVRIRAASDASVHWFHAMGDPSLDLAMPIKGPFNFVREGSADIHRAMLQLCKDAGLLPAIAVARADTVPVGLSEMTFADLNIVEKSPLDLISSARVPLSVAKNSRVIVYRKHDGGEEHYAIEVGNPARDAPVLSRLHSACFTGDLIGSLKCDCGAQLQTALDHIGAEGAGVLLYLNQEGRGIGLANKMRAYALQDQGFDTVEANHRLGFEDDERDLRLGAEILRGLGFSSVRLMTNNPAKLARMEENGITVAERVPLKVGQTVENKAYLETKARKSGHIL